MQEFLRGVFAGYGIAIPVGAIAILIIETGIRQGFSHAFAAGAGAATADLIYAALAASMGGILSELITPISWQVHLVSALVLIALGAHGLYKSLRRSPGEFSHTNSIETSGLLKTYTKFSSLTLLNPMTILYFTALITPFQGAVGGLDIASVWLPRAAFVCGAALASLSWQSLLAALGALTHRRFSPRLLKITSLLGSLLVMGLGVNILLS